jgi:hypothetical protein
MSAQTGGMNPIQVVISNMDSPYKLIYGFLMVLVIIYSSVIPSEYRNFADTILGRLLGIIIVYGVIQSLGWVYGLLTAMAFLIVVFGSSRLESVEAFEGGGTINEKKIIGKRWFVEKVLGEKPKRIETDKVQTSAIEGLSSGSMMV